MQLARPYFAPHPFRFGRGRVRLLGPAVVTSHPPLSDDVKLFATTFAAGFLFVSMLIG
jgi:hypothetical protein